jgi:hypothetical protein
MQSGWSPESIRKKPRHRAIVLNGMAAGGWLDALPGGGRGFRAPARQGPADRGACVGY